MAIKIDTHNLVPKHVIMPKETYSELLSKLQVETSEQLPIILRNDPSIKRLKPEKGDIIKISRKSLTAGSNTYYRVVR